MDLDVNAVQERPADLFLVTLDIPGPASTLMDAVLFSPKAAGAGILGCYQDEISRESQCCLNAADGNNPVLQRLPENLQGTASKFRQFIKKEYPMMT